MSAVKEAFKKAAAKAKKASKKAAAEAAESEQRKSSKKGKKSGQQKKNTAPQNNPVKNIEPQQPATPPQAPVVDNSEQLKRSVQMELQGLKGNATDDYIDEISDIASSHNESRVVNKVAENPTTSTHPETSPPPVSKVQEEVPPPSTPKPTERTSADAQPETVTPTVQQTAENTTIDTQSNKKADTEGSGLNELQQKARNSFLNDYSGLETRFGLSKNDIENAWEDYGNHIKALYQQGGFKTIEEAIDKHSEMTQQMRDKFYTELNNVVKKNPKATTEEVSSYMSGWMKEQSQFHTDDSMYTLKKALSNAQGVELENLSSTMRSYEKSMDKVFSARRNYEDMIKNNKEQVENILKQNHVSVNEEITAGAKIKIGLEHNGNFELGNFFDEVPNIGTKAVGGLALFGVTNMLLSGGSASNAQLYNNNGQYYSTY